MNKYIKKRGSHPDRDRPPTYCVRREFYSPTVNNNFITMKNNRNIIIISTWNLYWSRFRKAYWRKGWRKLGWRPMLLSKT